jgi:hypothetical protein
VTRFIRLVFLGVFLLAGIEALGLVFHGGEARVSAQTNGGTPLAFGSAPKAVDTACATTGDGNGEVCCFNNPAYSGTCRVEPAGDETCESILLYLNNPMSQGKSYCGGTKVRQGWQQVRCEGSDGSARTSRPFGEDAIHDREQALGFGGR